jgi:hypothetical protein
MVSGPGRGGRAAQLEKKIKKKNKKKHFPPLIAKILLILVHMFFLPYVDILGWLLEGGGEAEKG